MSCMCTWIYEWWVCLCKCKQNDLDGYILNWNGDYTWDSNGEMRWGRVIKEFSFVNIGWTSQDYISVLPVSLENIMLTRKLIYREEVALVESQAPSQRWFHTMRSLHIYTTKKGIGGKWNIKCLCSHNGLLILLSVSHFPCPLWCLLVCTSIHSLSSPHTF